MKKLKLNKKRLGVLLDHQMSAIQGGQGDPRPTTGNTQETEDCDTDPCASQKTTEITTSRPIEATSNPPRTCLG
ncbi:MAG TPA: hypothetical protein DCS93_39570 [Microscillaceae bacterium]|nr:hypothetical protein [Microscillaceae bacterium]